MKREEGKERGTDEGRDAVSFLSVGAATCPMRTNFIRRNRRGEKSLPLEGGAPRSESKIYMTASGSHTSTMVVRLKPDRMRSKVAILYHPMVIIFSFDLISRN